MTYNYPTAGSNNGRMTQSVDAVNGETITYQYDALKRLSTASSMLGWAESYTYDGFSNLTQMTPTQGSAPYLNAINAATNHITGAAYDLNGNMTNVAGHSLGYDVANRLVTVGGSFVYAYAANNERVYYRSSSGTDTIYLYGAFGEKLATYAITGYQGSEILLTQQSTNVYFAGRLISAEGNSVSTDLVDSVRWSAAGGGTARTYFPYGTEYATTGNDTEKYATYTRDSLTGKMNMKPQTLLPLVLFSIFAVAATVQTDDQRLKPGKLCPDVITDMVPGLHARLARQGLAHVEVRQCGGAGGPLQVVA